MGKNYILEPSYRKIVEFTLSEINTRSYFTVKSISKWYITNELNLPINSKLTHRTSLKISRIVRELVNLNIVIWDGGTRYKNLNKGNIRKVLKEQIGKEYIIKSNEKE